MSKVILDKIIKQEHFTTILKYINLKCPNIRKPDYTPSYFLSNILSVLGDFVTWSSLKNSRICKNKYSFHYKSISRIHLKWSRAGVYEDAYKEIVVNDEDLYFTDNETKKIHLLIDATLIINKTGVEGIGYGGETKKKKFTKLTALCNSNIENVAVIANKSNVKNKIEKTEKKIKKLSIKNIEIHLKNTFSIDKKKNKKEKDIKLYGKNDKIKNIKVYGKVDKNEKSIVKVIEEKNSFKITNKNKFEKVDNDDESEINVIEENKLSKNKKDINKIQTLEHDIKGIKPALDMIGIKNKDINIIGDKGYLINDSFKKDLNDIKVSVIAPKRKNQKIKNTDEEKYCLKERYKIENSFAKIKVFNFISSNMHSKRKI